MGPPEFVLEGQVVDENDKPIAAAEVAVVGTSRWPRPGGNLYRGLVAFGAAKTDSQGRFRLGLPSISSAQFEHVTARAGAAGYGLNWQPVALDAKRQEVHIRLSAEQPVRGRVLDKQGRPAANVMVHLLGVAGQTAWLGNGMTWPEYLPGARRSVCPVGRRRPRPTARAASSCTG
jgi:hypothetical protein